MKKSTQLKSIGIMILLMFTQTVVSSVIEHKDTPSRVKQFIRAVRDGDTEKLKKLHAQDDFLVNYQDGVDGWSALHHAAHSQRRYVIALLLSLKANIHAKNN